jgi:hypothetical protein
MGPPAAPPATIIFLSSLLPSWQRGPPAALSLAGIATSLSLLPRPILSCAQIQGVCCHSVHTLPNNLDSLLQETNPGQIIKNHLRFICW